LKIFYILYFPNQEFLGKHGRKDVGRYWKGQKKKIERKKGKKSKSKVPKWLMF
jgi:hypothetical protein